MIYKAPKSQKESAHIPCPSPTQTHENPHENIHNHGSPAIYASDTFVL